MHKPIYEKEINIEKYLDIGSRCNRKYVSISRSD